MKLRDGECFSSPNWLILGLDRSGFGTQASEPIYSHYELDARADALFLDKIRYCEKSSCIALYGQHGQPAFAIPRTTVIETWLDGKIYAPNASLQGPKMRARSCV